MSSSLLLHKQRDIEVTVDNAGRRAIFLDMSFHDGAAEKALVDGHHHFSKPIGPRSYESDHPIT
jgi:hypothetical protein